MDKYTILDEKVNMKALGYSGPMVTHIAKIIKKGILKGIAEG